MENLLNYECFFEAITEIPAFIKSLKVGQSVHYKRDGYNNDVDYSKQSDKVGYDKIEKIDYNTGVVTFKDLEGKDFTKSANKIFPPNTNVNDIAKTNTELRKVLGTIKNNPVKMRQVLTYVEYVSKQK